MSYILIDKEFSMRGSKVLFFLPEKQGQLPSGALLSVITYSDKFGFFSPLEVQMPPLHLVFYMLQNLQTKQ